MDISHINIMAEPTPPHRRGIIALPAPKALFWDKARLSQHRPL
jgi:hypothetical protein